MSSNFVHLHVHSEYSLLDGLSKIKNLVRAVKQFDMPAVALTDHGAMYGAIEFYKECTKEKIKPLIGMEGYIVGRDLHDKSGKGENYHLLLIARNFTGYKNLMQLSSIAHLEGFYYRPRFDKDTLKKYSEGLICTSTCPKGEVGQLLIAGNYQAANQAVIWYADVFGQNNYYLEIQRHFYQDYFDSAKNQPQVLGKLQDLQKSEKIWIDGIVKLSRDIGLPLVATNDAHYLNQSDATAQDALVCISTGKNVTDTDRIRYIDTPTFYLRPSLEMDHIFSDYPEAVKNTLQIADQCEVQIELGKWHFPNIDLPKGRDPATTLREMVDSHVSTRYPNVNPDLQKRVDMELDTIISKGYAPYFLLLADLVSWCSDHGIITNTRGSAAGSVVSYIIGITTVDPIRYLLPFERFLNPFRPSPPDIDLDIADDRREELIAHVTEKFGRDKVAQICTFGRMLARAAVRDIARVLGHPYSFGDRIAKIIPIGSQGFPMTIDRALDESPEFKIMYDTDPAAKQVIDLGREIEGNARHASVHAAGIVVSPTDMKDFTPLQLEPNGDKVITQYEMHACEEVGLVKFDILGIRNLSILGAARDIVERERDVKVELAKIPLDDKKTFAMLSSGQTMGVFQMGGPGMTKWLRELRPTRIEDLMVMIALFRPGPMANIPEFISRKHGQKKVEFLHPKMAKYLDKSYGILVYQDDVLFTALELAGYDWNSVDKFRKAIGKKIPEEMAKQHEIFVTGCQKTSDMSKAQAEALWDLFVPFQGYGFNKAHAASYGIVSYQTAYLKANYPVEYMTALLTAEAGNTDKIVEAVEECKRMKIKVLPPQINKSDTGFTIEPDTGSLDGRAIRFGLSAIKNVGEVAIHIILSSRQNKPFSSLTDFCLRVDAQKVNRKVLESLIKAGSMDIFGNRAAMLAGLDKIREQGISINKLKSLGQSSLFGDAQNTPNPEDQLPQIEELEKSQKLELEKDLLGFYLTEHPHSGNLDLLKKTISKSISDLFLEDTTGQTITTGGVIESVRNVTTKSSGLQMCFARVTDLTRSAEVVVFPKVFAITSSCWQPNNLVLISGRIENRKSEGSADSDEEASHEITIIAQSAAIFAGPETRLPQVSTPSSPKDVTGQPKVTIYIPPSTPQTKLVTLNTLLQTHKGSKPATLVFTTGSSSKEVPLPYGLNWNPNLEAKINALLNSPHLG
ncbi:DNA polymerase III subunit alpha [Candidatus Amesbacteria bacterium RIFCSPHIGHO2_01_FULL_48_32]|uniref:DNA-directed DNA polymerase n=1 Tax=Candidatus Amesbacteria bacterium RIFCSPLOWO2_01_FULL_48_25 TaxID=1797259 RepID=A0A1F4ZD82_9BACT|nr:MAG: DNA polymerase III subunit alpha [Candidatus Amesbacteria bacterium RIFCSPHIGHO2_01_FULL_48_32]OGD03916.1 MAG: DNA polymerase III subunit alpha [Candidatus Amesbacteria bacterium RIFCSPLOWO2_01_FULL_48_25]HJZ05855.1 DNA polymerase III subunit alpha [Patescibacteria group bacterium]